MYGFQWRSWPGKDGQSVDQITKVVEQIRNNPDSRRHMVVAYNPAYVDDMALPPLPRLNIKRRPDSIFDYRFEDFEIVDYQAHPHIPAPVAV